MTPKSRHFQTPGFHYHDFVVVQTQEIHELQCELRELEHLPTGAKVMHIANEDPENLFCLSFQTLPASSDGAAHILEHTVLCGSRKYPVKDPFFAMTRRSLNTFMNALTGSDFTCYPAASQVSKDFYNLLDVYLDAVFHPKLDRLSFMQEGHRLEFTNPKDPASPLEYKGIVFNEMKGALSSAEARLGEALHQHLFPDSPYGLNSGGDPKVIPRLTYSQLLRFHKQYYHPSRCLFFFYGSFPLEDHLAFISEKALKRCRRMEPLFPIPPQPRFLKPKHLEEAYPIPSGESIQDKTYISYAWLTCSILEQEELLALSILDIILLDTDASPLKLALLKSGLCKHVSSAIDSDLSEVPFFINLRGCSPEHAGVLKELLFSTLSKIVKTGIPLEKVENALHQLEFYRSEISGDHAPFGLSLFMRSALLKQHGVQPDIGLKIHSLFDDLRRRNLEDPGYLTGLIEKYLIDNPHFVELVMKPDQHLAAKELAEEKAQLDKVRRRLSPTRIQKIVSQAEELANFQAAQSEANLDVLPKVTLEDVPKMAREFSLAREKQGNLEIFHHACFTNKIIYSDLVFNLPELAEEDLPLVRLMAVLLPQIGNGKRSYAANLDYIQANIGGFSASLCFNLQALNHLEFHPTFNIRGKALHRKADKLFQLIADTAASLDFTNIPRLKEVILKHYTSLQSTLSQNALKYAINLSASGLDSSSKLANTWYGLDYYRKIKDIAEHFDRDSKTLVTKLCELQEKLFSVENPHLVITCEAEMYDSLKNHRFYGLSAIETKPGKPWRVGYAISPARSQGCVIASPVAFTGKVFKSVSYVHPDAPALNAAAFLLDNLTLHARIREQGGAYGGGATHNSTAANFYFYAYRDPNIASTLEAFEEAVKQIANGEFDEEHLTEAKLEMVQGLDSPVAPGSRGDAAYGWFREGKTHALRQAFRERLLGLKREDVINAVREHLLPNYEKSATVVFAGKELLEKENALLAAKGREPLTLEALSL